MTEIPLSRLKALYPAADMTNGAQLLAASLDACRSALEAHMMGEPGRPAPAIDPLFEVLIARVPETGPVADRGPDRFVIQPYTVVDDTPLSPEAQLAIDTLRATISG